MRTLITLVVFLFAAFAQAETIRLVNGKEVEGTIIRSNAINITVKTRTGVSTYQLSEVDRSSIPEITSQTPAPIPIASSRPTSESATDKYVLSFYTSLARASVGLKLAGFVWLIGSGWFIIVGFSESILWGLFILVFNWVAALIFSAFHWKKAWRPLLLLILSLVVFLVTCEWALLPFTYWMKTTGQPTNAPYSSPAPQVQKR